ncbi:MAG: transposase [Deltaproteobacteria bacterium]|nr:transposase [Deltaproteobacteria bacterium]
MRDIQTYNQVIRKLRDFFQDELGFVEVPAQSRLSILAACEDPATITQFQMDKIPFPLPQTGQMWLEVELLKNPGLPGVFCSTTSYRNEPNPIPGRHEKVFPMFEFEAPGNLDDLRKIEKRLLRCLGFDAPLSLQYEDMCQKYDVKELKAEQELQMQGDFGNVLLLENFPHRTDPFWNMKHKGNGLYNKIDVILHGFESIGSAERSSNVDEMRENFYTVSDGKYASLLFSAFGRERVEAELESYFALKFFPRFGAGIGVTRLARAMHLSKLLKDYSKAA